MPEESTDSSGILIEFNYSTSGFFGTHAKMFYAYPWSGRFSFLIRLRRGAG